MTSVSERPNSTPPTTSTLTGLRTPAGIRRTSAIANNPNGKLSQNAHSHDANSVSRPPQSGPITPPASALAPTSAYAISIRLAGSTSPAAAIAIGMIAPPPMAWITLAATVHSRPGPSCPNHTGICMLNATSADPTIKIDIATEKARRWPILSENLPMRGMAAVKPIRYPVMVQDALPSSVADTSRSISIAGSSVTTTV